MLSVKQLKALKWIQNNFTIRKNEQGQLIINPSYLDVDGGLVQKTIPFKDFWNQFEINAVEGRKISDLLETGIDPIYVIYLDAPQNLKPAIKQLIQQKISQKKLEIPLELIEEAIS